LFSLEVERLIMDETQFTQHLLEENRRQKALLAAIFEAEPGGLAVLEGDQLCFTYVNPAYRYITPNPELDPIDQPYASVWSMDEATDFDRFRLEDVLKTGRPYQRNNFVRHYSDGSTMTFTLQARRIDWDGQPAVLQILWDMTELKHVEGQLLRERELLEKLVDRLPVMITLFRPDTQVFHVNPEFERLTGWTKAEIQKGNLLESVYPDPQVRAEAFQYMEGLQEGWRDFPLVTRSGAILESSWSNIHLSDDTRIGIGIDVRGPKLTERTLQALQSANQTQIQEMESENQRLAAELKVRASTETALRKEGAAIQLNLSEVEAVINSMSETVLIADTHENILTINPAGLELFGFTSAAQIPSSIHSFNNLFETRLIDGTLVPIEARPLARASRGDLVKNLEMHVRRVDNDKNWTGLYSATPVRNARGEVIRVMVTIVDLTQLRQAEKEARERMARMEVQHRLIDQREQERVRIARDLHDGPIQEIIGTNFGLQALISELDESPMRAELVEIQERLQRLASDLRVVASDLRPPALSRFGLEKAIRSHLDVFQEKHTELSIRLEAHQVGHLIAEPIRLALYRIYQESLVNILKHAQATEVVIRLTKTSDQIQLEIQDNGRGFTMPGDWMELAHDGHLGLVGIQERAEAVGGQVQVISGPEIGTCIRVMVPCSDELQ
jgi:PAS domain S-box-containing protein